MTMDYRLKNPTIAGELHPGDRITAKVLADQTATSYTNIQLDDIVVIAQARPDYKPAVSYHVPTPGDTVPDFHLLNQSDRTIHLAQFKGKLVLMTFIYTRCPLADYCPRMSRNFADIDKALSTDPALYERRISSPSASIPPMTHRRSFAAMAAPTPATTPTKDFSIGTSLHRQRKISPP